VLNQNAGNTSELTMPLATLSPCSAIAQQQKWHITCSAKKIKFYWHIRGLPQLDEHIHKACSVHQARQKKQREYSPNNLAHGIQAAARRLWKINYLIRVRLQQQCGSGAEASK
jgi:hypothetical protein